MPPYNCTIPNNLRIAAFVSTRRLGPSAMIRPAFIRMPHSQIQSVQHPAVTPEGGQVFEIEKQRGGGNRHRTSEPSCPRSGNPRISVHVDSSKVAEGEGFEPPEPCGSAVFKTAAIDHSATLPTGWGKVSRPSDRSTAEIDGHLAARQHGGNEGIAEVEGAADVDGVQEIEVGSLGADEIADMVDAGIIDEDVVV